MEQQIIEAEIRTETGKNAARYLRRTGKAPAILYGVGKESISLSLNPRQLVSVLRAQGGRNTIFNLQVKGGESVPAMVVESQFEPVQGTLLHVDFKRIAMDQKLRVFVPIVPRGEAQGVKLQGGILEVVMREVEVECLPANIPERLPVEVETLVIGEHVRVADLQERLGDRVHLLSDPNAVICHVIPKVVEVKPAVEAVAEAPVEPEVIKKGKAAAKEEELAEPREEREKKQ